MKMNKRKVKRFKKPYVNKRYRFMFAKGYIPKRYNIFYGGTGSSKSFSVYTRMVQNCLESSTFDILIVRKFQTTLEDTVIKPIINIMSKYYKNSKTDNGLVEGVDYVYNRTQRRIVFKNGATIRFKGYDNPEKLKGIDNVNVLVLEEVTDFTREDLQDIQDRLRGTPEDNHPWGKELKIFMMFNPIFKTHWVRDEFFEDEIDMTNEIHIDIVKDLEITFALKTTWRDNKFYNGQYKDPKLAAKVKKNNPRKYGVQCNGNWGVLGKLIFESYKVIKCIQEESYYDDISYGLDFGFQHKSAYLKLGLKDGDIYVLGGFYLPKLTASNIIKQVKKCNPENYKKIKIYCDCARPEIIEQMNNEGIRRAIACKKGKGSVLDGIEWIQDRMIYIDESQVGLVNEIESYQWKVDKKTGERLPEPIKVNDDACDGLRYGTEKWRKKKNEIRIREV